MNTRQYIAGKLINPMWYMVEHNMPTFGLWIASIIDSIYYKKL